MISALRSRSRTQRALLCLVGAVLLLLVTLEGLNAPYPATAAATALCGMLCLTALGVPDRMFARQAVLAAAASCALTAVQTQLPQRPENTPGMIELCALLLLIIRAVRRHPASKAAAYAATPALAATFLPLRLAAWNSETMALIGLTALCAVPFAVAFGMCLRRYDTLRARERESIRQAQRLDQARELHDFVAHHVTAMVTLTKAARFSAAAGRVQSPEEHDRMLAGIELTGAQAMMAMRAMVFDLREGGSAPLTTPATVDLTGLRELTDRFSALGPRPSAALTLDPRIIGLSIPPAAALAIHRLVQESLTNVRKHATGADRVEVRVALRPGARDTLEVSVTDDGRGAAAAARGKPDGHGNGNRNAYGLAGLAERVEAVGGHLSAGPHDGSGWRVHAVVPLDRETACSPG